MRQEFLGQNFNDIAWSSEFNSAQWVNFAQSFGPVAVRAESLINVCGCVDEFNTYILFFEIIFNKCFNGESFTFKEIFSEGNPLLAFGINWIDDKLLDGFNDTENAAVFLEELTGERWGLFFPHFFEFLLDWLIDQVVVLFQGIKLD